MTYDPLSENNQEIKSIYPERTAIYNDKDKLLTIFYCNEIEEQYSSCENMDQAKNVFFNFIDQLEADHLV